MARAHFVYLPDLSEDHSMSDERGAVVATKRLRKVHLKHDLHARRLVENPTGRLYQTIILVPKPRTPSTRPSPPNRGAGVRLDSVSDAVVQRPLWVREEEHKLL